VLRYPRSSTILPCRTWREGDARGAEEGRACRTWREGDARGVKEGRRCTCCGALLGLGGKTAGAQAKGHPGPPRDYKQERKGRTKSGQTRAPTYVPSVHHQGALSTLSIRYPRRSGVEKACASYFNKHPKKPPFDDVTTHERQRLEGYGSKGVTSKVKTKTLRFFLNRAL
jgi:hypothetical protein